jgi:hypothetical protein
VPSSRARERRGILEVVQAEEGELTHGTA